ncbi:DUF3006 domain-containing protein [Patescibacteria group bacterium]|nr:DUF3006 domain-containing protein [Patescibacteria group bacterium]
MNENHTNKLGKLNATLKKIDGGYAHFEVENGIEGEGNIIQWPINELPDGIQIGDIISLNLNFALNEERQAMIRQQEEKETKFQEMRNLLEDLVN